MGVGVCVGVCVGVGVSVGGGMVFVGVGVAVEVGVSVGGSGVFVGVGVLVGGRGVVGVSVAGIGKMAGGLMMIKLIIRTITINPVIAPPIFRIVEIFTR